MGPQFVFVLNSLLLGVGLAMDAFSVSLADGLSEPGMRGRKMCGIAGTFAFFQALMPMLGWVCVHTVIQYFSSLASFVPWIAFILLLFIGGKMFFGGIKELFRSKKGEKEEDDPEKVKGVTAAVLFVQGIATSIDALSVGFTIAEYGLAEALLCALLIAAVTFLICIGALVIGKGFGTVLSDKAEILGGAILIIIGIEIFVTGVLL